MQWLRKNRNCWTGATSFNGELGACFCICKEFKSHNGICKSLGTCFILRKPMK